MRKVLRLVFSLALVTGTVVAAPASADSLFGDISGTVTDGLGAPLSRVRVDLESQTVFTDEQGRYRIEVFDDSSRTMYVSRADLHTAFRRVRSSVLEPDQTQDFTVYYRITAWTSPSTVAAPGTTTVTAETWTPGNICVTAAEGTNSAELAESGNGADGSRRFAGTFSVPEGSASGFHYLSVTARDCASATVLGNGTAYYFVSGSVPPPPVPDTTLPTILVVNPKQGHMAHRQTDLGESPNGKTMVIGAIRFRVEVKDDKWVRSVYFELFDSTGSLTWHCDAESSGSAYLCDEEITFFSSSSYTFKVTAKDTSGNVSVAEQGFVSYIGPVDRDRLVEL